MEALQLLLLLLINDTNSVGITVVVYKQGVDPRIKVTYKPLQRYREQSGILSKTVNYTMKQSTVIKNTLSDQAIITLTDHVPRSQEEKLKVSFIKYTKQLKHRAAESMGLWSYSPT